MGQSQSGGMTSKEVKTLVDEAIKSKKVVVFSKSWCPYCKKAKKVLQNYDIADDLKIIEIDGDDKENEIQDYLKELTGARSVPRVFINRECIGGGDETAAVDKNGLLETKFHLQRVAKR